MSDSENILQAVKAAIQDVVAPDVRELKVKSDTLRQQIQEVDKRLSEQISSVDKRLSEQIASVDKRLSEQIASLERRMQENFAAQNTMLDAQFHALLAALGQHKAETELMVVKQLSSFDQRLTRVEARLTEQRAA